MTAPAPNTWPALVYDDARPAIRFLTDVVGFRERAVYGNGERIDHAELDWPEGGGLMLGSRKRAGESRMARIGPSAVYLVSADPDAVHARVAASGVETDALRDTDYGSREFGFVDAEGNYFTVGTYPGADV